MHHGMACLVSFARVLCVDLNQQAALRRPKAGRDQSITGQLGEIELMFIDLGQHTSSFFFLI
jgi:hypothetical protein